MSQFNIIILDPVILAFLLPTTEILLNSNFRGPLFSRTCQAREIREIKGTRKKRVLQYYGLSVCRSVRPSVCPSFRHFPVCFVQTNEHTIVRSSASGRTVILDCEESKLIRIFANDHPREDVKVWHSPVASENLTNNRP